MKRKIGLAVAALVIAASAGGLALAAQGDDEADNGAGTGLPNPAAVFCEDQGGSVEIVADAEGNQSGICRLPDGTQIEEWEYWRQFHGKGVDASEVGEAPETGGPTPLAPAGVKDDPSQVQLEPGDPSPDDYVWDEDGNLVLSPEFRPQN